MPDTRYYDPETERYLQPDRGDRVPNYTYASNNPLSSGRVGGKIMQSGSSVIQQFPTLNTNLAGPADSPGPSPASATGALDALPAAPTIRFCLQITNEGVQTGKPLTIGGRIINVVTFFGRVTNHCGQPIRLVQYRFRTHSTCPVDFEQGRDVYSNWAYTNPSGLDSNGDYAGATAENSSYCYADGTNATYSLDFVVQARAYDTVHGYPLTPDGKQPTGLQQFGGIGRHDHVVTFRGQITL